MSGQRLGGIALFLLLLVGVAMCGRVVERQAAERRAERYAERTAAAERTADKTRLIATAMDEPGGVDLIADAYIAADAAFLADEIEAAGEALRNLVDADLRRGHRQAAAADEVAGRLFQAVKIALQATGDTAAEVEAIGALADDMGIEVIVGFAYKVNADAMDKAAAAALAAAEASPASTGFHTVAEVLRARADAAHRAYVAAEGRR